jgi:hypothetical protein
MSNIIGESFDDYVKTQVDVRQKVLGKTTRTSEDLVYLNSKTAWLRLASSVNINKEYFSNTNPNPDLQNLTDDKLARKFILLGGTSDDGGSLATGNFGVNQSNIFDNQTYGLGGISDFGFKPLPGLNSAKVTSYNRGSLRKATIKITANNPEQFYIVDTLYMKLGYTVLLEWGWTIYKDNNSTNQTAPDDSVFNTFLKGTTFDVILSKLEDTRIKTACNQDGFIGYVTNFRWSFNQDGLYDIEIDVVSIGSVIESLNINKIYPLGDISSNTKPSTITQYLLTPITPTDAAQPDATNVLTPSQLPVNPNNSNVVNVFENVPISSFLVNKAINFIYLCEEKLSNTSNTNYANTELGYIDSKYTNPIFGVIKNTLLDENPVDAKLSNFTYIKLGAFLDFINTELLLYNKNTTYSNIITIYTGDSNKFYLPPLSLSGDPITCVIPFIYGDGSGNYQEYEYNDIIGYDVKSKDNLLKGFDGNLMHLYIGLSKIEEIYLLSVDENYKISLYTFLENLMSSINRALGSINNFEVIYDDVVNLIKIIDSTNIPGITTKPSSTINVNGVYKNDVIGSFVRNISLNSELSNQMASSIAIGAQAQGIKIPQDSTAFSKWYQGLEDRIIPYKLDANDVKKGAITTITGSIEDQLTDQYALNIGKLADYINTVYVQVTPASPALDSLQSLNSEITQYRNGLYVQNDVIGIQGFIPLNLNLTMDGISGMKIYQKFKITQDILPPLYPKKLNFLIRGIDHEIDKNGWRTNIQTFSIGADYPIKTNLLPKINPKPKPSSVPKYFENYSGLIERIIMYAWSVGITDKYQVAAILTVAASESGMGQSLVEKMNYPSVKRLREVFPSYFKTKPDSYVQQYVNNGELLGNLVYGGKYENNKTGDGFLYRGRGLNHVTFKAGYRAAQKSLLEDQLAPIYFLIDDLLDDRKLNNSYTVKWGWLKSIDLVTNPELLEKGNDLILKPYNITKGRNAGTEAKFVINSSYPHLAIIILVLGKKKGIFGNFINTVGAVNYSTRAVILTNNGAGGNGNPKILQSTIDVYQPNRDYFFSDENLGKIIAIQDKWKPYISSTGAGAIVSETPQF